MSVRFGIGRGVYGMRSGGVWRRTRGRDTVSRNPGSREKEILRMRRALWNGLAACVAIVALLASPAALAAKKKTPTPAAGASSASTAADKTAKTEKVNLNTADEKAIAGAKGVGDKLRSSSRTALTRRGKRSRRSRASARARSSTLSRR